MSIELSDLEHTNICETCRVLFRINDDERATIQFNCNRCEVQLRK